MATRLEDKNRKYKRFRHSAEEKLTLAGEGLQHVLSSNVSAIGTSGKDLIVRFHGGATYQYSNASNLYNKMLQSNSKGKFVWNQLRKKNVPFQKIASVPLPSDEEFKGLDLMATVEKVAKRTQLAKELAQVGIVLNKADLMASGIITKDIKQLVLGYSG